MAKKHKPVTGAPERRTCFSEVRAEREDQGAYITGHPIVFNQITEIGGMFREVIAPLAVDDQTDMRDVCLLVGHDDRMIPLARSRNNNGNSTMRLTIDPIGVAMRASLDPERNGTASALYSAADRGDISGMSFRFCVDKEQWEEMEAVMPLRRILHISRIFEVSAAAFPAYGGTDLEAADENGRLESLAASLESARKRLQEDRERLEDAERREKALQALRR